MTNLRSSLFALALSVAAAACQKAPDFNKIQSQALLTVKSYGGQLDVLQRRADANLTRFRTMGQNLPGANEAGRRLGDARSKLEQLRTVVAGAPSTLAAAAKNGRTAELQAAIDNTNDALVKGTLEVTADLTAFENWAAFARPTVAMATPPTAPPATPPDEATAPAGTEEKIGEHPPGTRVEPVTGVPPVPTGATAPRMPAPGTPGNPPPAGQPIRQSDGGAAKPAAPARPAAPAATPPAKPATTPARPAGAGPRPPAAPGSAAKP